MGMIGMNKSKRSLLERAHIGDISGAEDLLNLARGYGIKTTPLDLEALMEILEIKVMYSYDLKSDESGSLEKEEDSGKWVCTVNANHHETRQRFTIAHELGHYVLHRTRQEKFVDTTATIATTTYYRSSDSRNLMEFEADSFAGDLLMPEADFGYFVRNISESIEDIAEHFKVSPAAVRVRAQQLGFKEKN